MGRRPLADSALESFVFRIDDGVRHKLTLDEARRRPERRRCRRASRCAPPLQDGVFPTVAMACGAAEIAYLAQLREVFEGLGVRPASPVPRLTATWLPRARRRADRRGAGHAVGRRGRGGRRARGISPSAPFPPTREDLDRAAPTAPPVSTGWRGRRGRSTSLDQMVDSARGKIDYQFARSQRGRRSARCGIGSSASIPPGRDCATS